SGAHLDFRVADAGLRTRIDGFSARTRQLQMGETAVSGFLPSQASSIWSLEHRCRRRWPPFPIRFQVSEIPAPLHDRPYPWPLAGGDTRIPLPTHSRAR